MGSGELTDLLTIITTCLDCMDVTETTKSLINSESVDDPPDTTTEITLLQLQKPRVESNTPTKRGKRRFTTEIATNKYPASKEEPELLAKITVTKATKVEPNGLSEWHFPFDIIDKKSLWWGFVGQADYGNVVKTVLVKHRHVSIWIHKHKAVQYDERSLVHQFRELHILRRLRHPNIVNLVCAYTQTAELHEFDTYHLVLDVSGRSLSKYFAEQVKFSLKVSKSIVFQTLRALHYLHSAGIAHGQFKPINIHRISAGIVKLVNLGQYPYLAVEDTNELMKQETHYQSPEDVSGWLPQSPATDIWSMAILMLQLMTNTIIFTAPNDLELVEKMIDLCKYPSKEFIARLDSHSKTFFDKPRNNLLQSASAERRLFKLIHDFYHGGESFKIHNYTTFLTFYIRSPSAEWPRTLPTKQKRTRVRHSACHTLHRYRPGGTPIGIRRHPRRILQQLLAARQLHVANCRHAD